MKARVALAALLGGLTLFAWGAFSHMVLQLGDSGLKMAPPAPGDEALLQSLSATLPESGMYMYPGMDPARLQDEAAMKEWEDRTKSRPHGVIVHTVEPYEGMGPQLAREALTDVAVALLCALLLSCVLGCCRSLPARVGFVGLLGLLVAYRPVQLWNWYHFPGQYSLAQVIDGVLGFLVMGVVIALLVRPKPGTGQAAT